MKTFLEPRQVTNEHPCERVLVENFVPMMGLVNDRYLMNRVRVDNIINHTH